jgi:hypothetical protein
MPLPLKLSICHYHYLSLWFCQAWNNITASRVLRTFTNIFYSSPPNDTAYCRPSSLRTAITNTLNKYLLRPQFVPAYHDAIPVAQICHLIRDEKTLLRNRPMAILNRDIGGVRRWHDYDQKYLELLQRSAAKAIFYHAFIRRQRRYRAIPMLTPHT